MNIKTSINGRIRAVSRERGQAIIMFVGFFTVIMLVGAIVIDFGLWFSERRGAQKDADATALAAVQAYIDDLGDTSGAFDDGFEWAVKNGVDPTKIDALPTSDCSPGNSCIQVEIGNCREDGTDTLMPWAEAKIRHESSSLFSGIFGLVAPDIGAVARACVGSPRTATDLSPYGIQTNFDADTGEPLSDCLELDPDQDPNDPPKTRPIYGAVCILKTGAGDSVSGQRGQLTIGNADCDQTSASTLKHDFHYGTGAACSLEQEVNTGSGNIIGLLQGLNDRLEDEGRCDERFFDGNAGYDDFSEVYSVVGDDPPDPLVPSPDHVFSENDCKITINPDDQGHVHTYQPRAIDLVLIDELEQGEQTATIVGFAAFYIIGCVDGDDAQAIKEAIELDLTQLGSYLNRCEHPTGQDVIMGIFVQSLAPPENVSDPDTNLPLAIVLVK